MTPTVDNPPFSTPEAAAGAADYVLEAVFTPGSLWNYHGNTVVRVLPRGVYTSAVGRFIRCEVVSSPTGQRSGHEDGYPAQALTPHRPYVSEAHCQQIACDVVKAMCDEVRAQQAEITRLEGMLSKAQWTMGPLQDQIRRQADTITKLAEQLRDEHRNANEEMLAMQMIVNSVRARVTN